MRLTEPHEQTGMTLLEGPVFDEHGELLVVDVTAPAGEPKLLRVNVRKKTSNPSTRTLAAPTPRPSSARTTDGST